MKNRMRRKERGGRDIMRKRKKERKIKGERNGGRKEEIQRNRE